LDKYKLWLTLPLLSMVVAFFPTVTLGQGPPARDYLNTPVDQIRFFVDLVGSNAVTAAQSDLPLPNFETVTRNGFLSFLWSFPLGNKYGGIAVSGGYATVHVDGPLGKVETSGFTDPGVTFHANFFGAPALRIDQFAAAVPKNYSSFHLTVNPPLGSYDRYSAVNTGGNRWSFTPVVNLDITPDKGVSWIDLYAGARFFTNNNEFQGNNQLSQNPLWVLTAHYSHNIGTRMWVAIGVHYDNGGQSFINHIPQNDYANGFRPGLAISRGFGKFRLTLRYENTASRPHAAPTNGLISFRVSGPVWPFF
jgi:hypothetical protein